MAKVVKKATQVAKVTPPKQAVAKANVNVDMMLEQYAGAGVSTDASDNTIPFIYLVQSLSPVALKAKPEYIKGAEAGNIWPRGEKHVWDGDEGIRVVPCFFSKCWVEWMPNRGGFVERHETKPEEAVLRTDPKDPKKKAWEMPNGNVVQESKEHTVLVLDKYEHPTPFVIPMTGTNLKSSKDWMTLMNRKQTAKGNIAASFSHSYVLTTIARTNDRGDWYMWEASDDGKVEDPAVLQEAIRVFKAFKGGELKGAADYGNDVADDDTDEDDNDDIA
jgi:hypothetical protein